MRAVVLRGGTHRLPVRDNYDVYICYDEYVHVVYLGLLQVYIDSTLPCGTQCPFKADVISTGKTTRRRASQTVDKHL